MARSFITVALALGSFPALAGGSIVLIGQTSAPDGGPRTKRGEFALHFVDRDGKPYAGAKVRLLCNAEAADPKDEGTIREARGDEQGWVFFTGMPPCVWVTEVSAERLGVMTAGSVDNAGEGVVPPTQILIDASRGGRLNRGFDLSHFDGGAPRGHDVDVRVTWGGGPPPPGTRLELGRASPGFELGPLDATGRARIHLLPLRDELYVVAETPYGSSAEVRIDHRTSVATIDLPKGHLLRGEVVDARGTRQRSCACASRLGFVPRCVAADARGGFAVELPTAETYDVYAGFWVPTVDSELCRGASQPRKAKPGDANIVLRVGDDEACADAGPCAQRRAEFRSPCTVSLEGLLSIHRKHDGCRSDVDCDDSRWGPEDQCQTTNKVLGEACFPADFPCPVRPPRACIAGMCATKGDPDPARTWEQAMEAARRVDATRK